MNNQANVDKWKNKVREANVLMEMLRENVEEKQGKREQCMKKINK